MDKMHFNKLFMQVFCKYINPDLSHSIKDDKAIGPASLL